MKTGMLILPCIIFAFLVSLLRGACGEEEQGWKWDNVWPPHGEGFGYKKDDYNNLTILPSFKTQFKYTDNIFNEHLNERGELTYTESPGLNLTLANLLRRNYVTFAELEELPEEIWPSEKLQKMAGLQPPDKIRYEGHILTFKGIMQKEEKEKLLKLSKDPKYKEAIEKLFSNARTTLNLNMGYLLDVVRNQSFSINNDEQQTFTSVLNLNKVPIGLIEPINIHIENIFEDLFAFGDAPDRRGRQWLNNKTTVAFKNIRPFYSDDRAAFNVEYRRFREDVRRAQASDRTDNTADLTFYYDLFKRRVSPSAPYTFSILADYLFSDVDYDTNNTRDSQVHIIRGGFAGSLTSKIQTFLLAGYEIRDFVTHTSPDFRGSYALASFKYYFYEKYDENGNFINKLDNYQLHFNFKRTTAPSTGVFFNRINAALSTKFVWKILEDHNDTEDSNGPEKNDRLTANFEYAYKNIRVPVQEVGNGGERKRLKTFRNSFSLGLDYKITEYSRANLNYKFTDKDSNFDINDPFDYEENALTAFVQFNF